MDIVEQNNGLLNLSKTNMKKIPKVDDAQAVRELILDDNELQKIDNIDSFLKIEKLSLSKNQLLRMYGVCRLHYLRELNLSYNGILTIEGLKELGQLTHLNLEGNNIKTIEHLNTNTNLEFLNLSENSIGSISDISFLKCLKELSLHGNRISHLRQCDKYLPTCLETLTLSKNNITDLNEICTLSHLCNLNSITICDNPCVQMTGNAIGFDYRPFVLNWCMSVKLIDGFVVNPMESLRAEWLYSQGRGRQFRIGEQAALSRYLSSVCPLSGEALENENERKLRLILSKAQLYQRQLQEQVTTTDSAATTPTNNSPSSIRRKGPPSRIQSPRFSRMGVRQNSPDTMSNSYHGNTSTTSLTTSQTENLAANHPNQLLEMTKSLIENFTTSENIMTQSLDTVILNNSSNNSSNPIILNTAAAQEYVSPMKQQNLNHIPCSANLYNDQPTAHVIMGGPLTAASKMVPVPESLMSPDCCPSTQISNSRINCASPQVPKTVKSKESRSSTVINKNTRTAKRTDNKISSPTMSPRRSHNNVNANRSSTVQQIKNSHSVHSDVSPDDETDLINVDKLKTIRNKAAQKIQKQKQNVDLSAQQHLTDNTNKLTENSAILIQKIWRGYSERKKTKKIVDILQKKRIQDYIGKLAQDMEKTKAALESDRKMQQFQMQAINALWKKVYVMENGTINCTDANRNINESIININNGETANMNESVHVVQDLTKTCTLLTNQVQQLQTSMRDILTCFKMLTTSSQNMPNSMPNQMTESILKNSCETQTTPQAEGLPPFPPTNNMQSQEKAQCVKLITNSTKVVRPSSLPISSSSETSPKTKSLEVEVVQVVVQPLPPVSPSSTISESVVEVEETVETTETTDVTEISIANEVETIQ